MAICGSKPTQWNICVCADERRLCVLVINPIAQDFSSGLKSADLNMKKITLLKIIFSKSLMKYIHPENLV